MLSIREQMGRPEASRLPFLENGEGPGEHLDGSDGGYRHLLVFILTLGLLKRQRGGVGGARGDAS